MKTNAPRCAGAGVCAAACLVARLGAAQSCHLPPRAEPNPAVFSAALRAETAGFSNSEYEGHFEGVVPSLSFRQPWFEVAASLPVYRIVRNGRSDVGPGDLLLQARAPIFRDREQGAALGLELAATLPTGNPDHELGMGHVMLMPSAWGTLGLGRLGLSARFGYAGGIAGSSEHHHHAGGTSPLVDPMNMSELDAAAAGSFAFTPSAFARLGLYGAVPVAIDDGRARAAGFAGLGVQGERVGTSLEVHLPLAGEPFTAKLLLEVAARF